jgi:hypothetical protein
MLRPDIVTLSAIIEDDHEMAELEHEAQQQEPSELVAGCVRWDALLVPPNHP